MDNHISYLTGFIDALEASSSLEFHNDKQDEIAVLESKLDASISTFDAVRKSYLSDLNKLREIYKPVFLELLKDIKTDKSKLEQLTNSKVTLRE